MIEELKKYNLFSNLNTDDLRELMSLAKEVTLKPEQVLVKEKSIAKNFFILTEGDITVTKQTQNSNESYQLNILHAGDVIGEMGLIENLPRSATLKAIKHAKVLAFNVDEIRQHPTLFPKISINLSKMLSQRLRYLNEVTVKSMHNELEETKKRNVLGTTTVGVLYFTGIYSLSLGIIEYIKSFVPNTSIISIIVLLIMGALTLNRLYKTGLPLTEFGITLKNGFHYAIKGVLYTLPALLVIFLVKWLYMKLANIPDGHMFDAINSFKLDGTFHWGLYLLSLFGYALFVPVQELIARSGLQHCLYMSLPGGHKGRTWESIILSNLMFALTHLHLTIAFALAALAPGIFWGWLYSRQKSIVAVSVSHILIGVFAFFTLGVEQFL